MNILITNDDGYNSEGIISLYQTLAKDDYNIINRLLVVAPDSERSVSGHSITYQIPVRIREIYKNGKMEIYSCSGSPADCVIIAKGYLENQIGFILSGINRGANMGMDLTVSGTFSAIIEGYIYDIPGIAISLFQYDDPDYTFASIFVYEFLYRYLDHVERDVLLNINIPPFHSLRRDIPPLLTYQSSFRHVAFLEPRHDPRQNLYFWIYWKRYKFIEQEDFEKKIDLYFKNSIEISDMEAVYNNCISITPVLMDFNILRKHGKYSNKDLNKLYYSMKEKILFISKDAFKTSLDKLQEIQKI